MPGSKSKPVYLIPPADPLIENFREELGQMEANNKSSFVINVPPDIVEEEQVAMLQEMILALQHFPQAIESMLFNVELKFEEIEGSSLYLPDEAWKGDTKYMRWFNRIGNFPLTLFFLQDSEARFYTLAGDLLADKKFIVGDEKEVAGRRKQKVGFEGQQVTLLRNRLFNGCLMLLLYCHGSGFYPKHYIESVLADYDLGLRYEKIYKQYELDIRHGIKLRVKRTNY